MTRYRVKVSGKIFESDDLRVLLKRAVKAKRGGREMVDSRSQLRPNIENSTVRSITIETISPR